MRAGDPAGAAQMTNVEQVATAGEKIASKDVGALLALADIPAVLLKIVILDLSWNAAAKYKYKIMKIRLSWVGQSTSALGHVR